MDDDQNLCIPLSLERNHFNSPMQSQRGNKHWMKSNEC